MDEYLEMGALLAPAACEPQWPLNAVELCILLPLNFHLIHTRLGPRLNLHKERSMPAGYAVVPAVGGGVLTVATVAALVVDYMDQLALDDGPPLMRYLSIATADTNKWPHWLFVMGCTVFSPSIVVTGLWQAQLAQKTIWRKC